MKRIATANWKGSGKDGKGVVSTASTVLSNAQYSFNSRFAEGVGTTTGMAGIRDASARVALLASGVLAGVADALRDQSKAKNST